MKISRDVTDRQAAAIVLHELTDNTGRRFVPLHRRKMEMVCEHFTSLALNTKRRMSEDARRRMAECVNRVLQIDPALRWEEKKIGKQTVKVPRVDLGACGLPCCECDDGSHHEIPVETILAEMRSIMVELVAADDADEAHALRWEYDALAGILRNHGIKVRTRNIWNEAVPPVVARVSITEAKRYQAWDGRWKVTAEFTDGTVELSLDRFTLFTRAENLASEVEAREAPRPLVPPAGWAPKEEGAEAPSDHSETETVVSGA